MISHSNRPRRVPASLARRTKQTNQIQIFYVLVSVDNWHYQKRRVHFTIDESFPNRRINSIKSDSITSPTAINSITPIKDDDCYFPTSSGRTEFICTLSRNWGDHHRKTCEGLNKVNAINWRFHVSRVYNYTNGIFHHWLLLINYAL